MSLQRSEQNGRCGFEVCQTLGFPHCGQLTERSEELGDGFKGCKR